MFYSNYIESVTQQMEETSITINKCMPTFASFMVPVCAPTLDKPSPWDPFVRSNSTCIVLKIIDPKFIEISVFDLSLIKF